MGERDFSRFRDFSEDFCRGTVHVQLLRSRRKGHASRQTRRYTTRCMDAFQITVCLLWFYKVISSILIEQLKHTCYPNARRHRHLKPWSFDGSLRIVRRLDLSVFASVRGLLFGFSRLPCQLV